MNRKLLYAATLSALAPTYVLAQGIEPGQRPSMMLYWSLPLDAQKRADSHSTLGLRLQAGSTSMPISPPPSPRHLAESEHRRH